MGELYPDYYALLMPDCYGAEDADVGRRRMVHLVKIGVDQRGATAIEYGLIAALIAVAAITAMSNLGKKVGNTFNNVTANMKA